MSRSKWRRSFQPSEVERRFLAGLELEGSTIVDVGALHGYMTLLFADAVGPAGRVIAYEPHPTACRSLRLNVAGAPNVSVRQVALADAPGELAFAYPRRRAKRGLGSAHPGVRDELLSRGAKPTTLTATTLDAEVAAGHVPPPTLVKIDVEGLELAVIRGMERTLAEHSPDLHIEIHGYDAVAGECELLLDTLETRGYRARHVETDRSVTTRSIHEAIPGHVYAHS
jgi:FkbM family methyltransferase